MAAGTLIPVEEYLRSVYRPDCDYVEGRLEERKVGERDPSLVQANLVAYFHSRRRETGIVALPEWRFRLAANRFRVPDVIVTHGMPEEQILSSAPLLCVEILSPEDRISRINLRVQEYLAFGVPVVWVVDPAEHRVWVYRHSGMEEAVGSVDLDGTGIEIPFTEIFE